MSQRETAHATASHAATLASSAHHVPLSSSANAIAAASVIARGSKRLDPRSWARAGRRGVTSGGYSGHEASAQRYTSTCVTV